METFKSLLIAEVRQISKHMIDLWSRGHKSWNRGLGQTLKYELKLRSVIITIILIFNPKMQI